MSEILRNICGVVITGAVTGAICALFKCMPKYSKLIMRILETEAKKRNADYVYDEALKIWDQVEEDFRICAKITERFENKSAYFDKLMIDKFHLTIDELNEIRQAVAGNKNANKNY